MKQKLYCRLLHIIKNICPVLLVTLMCSIFVSGCTGPGKATEEKLRPIVLKMWQDSMVEGTADKMKIEVLGQEGVFAKTYIGIDNDKELVYFHCASGEWQMINIVGKMTPEICKQLKIPKALWP